MNNAIRERIPDSEIARACAVPIVDIVSRYVELRRKGSELFARCPFHNERTGSFHVVPKHGYYHCFGCSAHGNGIRFVMQREGLSFPEAVRFILGNSTPAKQIAPPAPAKRIEPERPPLILKLWDAAKDESLVEHYLYTRGIRMRPKRVPEALRGHRAVPYYESAGSERPTTAPPWRAWRAPLGEWFRRADLPAMLAALTDNDGRVCAIQQTWIKTTVICDGGIPEKGARNTDLETSKKTAGKMAGALVRLTPPSRTLAIGEGTESALSFTQIYGIRCWSACGLSRLGYPGHWVEPGNGPRYWAEERPPSIEIPPETDRLIIAGDNGSIAHEVADFAAWYFSKQGLEASAAYPPDEFSDFNAELIGS